MSKKVIICPCCSGSGQIPEDARLIRCHVCEGSGRVWQLIKYEPFHS